MVVRSLDIEKDPFRSKEDEDLLQPICPPLIAIGALIYPENGTKPDIAFATSLLARFSSALTKQDWNGIQHFLRYLRGTEDLSLFFRKNADIILVAYGDVRYLFDPNKSISQTGYVFRY